MTQRIEASAPIIINVNKDGYVHGGGGGIRTPVTCEGKHDFESCAFDHSATPPHQGILMAGNGGILPALPRGRKSIHRYGIPIPQNITTKNIASYRIEQHACARILGTRYTQGDSLLERPWPHTQHIPPIPNKWDSPPLPHGLVQEQGRRISNIQTIRLAKHGDPYRLIRHVQPG